MKIVIATDSFKGCCSSLDAAAAFEKGILRVNSKAEIIKVPIADGGEGTVDAVIACTKGTIIEVNVTGPIGNTIHAHYGLIDKHTAIMEMAAASGLILVPEDKRNPLLTTSYGTGEMIKNALDIGCKKIIIGIGGSATNDGGIGMAQALGAVFKNSNGTILGLGAKEISKLAEIDMSNFDKRISDCEMTVLCDVSNPLTGPLGASYVYGPQKGATPTDLPILDANLAHLADCIKKSLGKDIKDIPGSGAAGGLGAGLVAFCNARLKPGIETILELTKIETYIKNADLVITGEGKIDSQSAFGKVPFGVAQIAKRNNVPVIAIVGSIGSGSDKLYEIGINSIISICDGPMSLDRSINEFPILAANAAERMMRIALIKLQ